MALTEAKALVKLNGSPLPCSIPLVQKTGTTIYPGALVSVATDGYCRPARESTTDTVVGYAKKNPVSQDGSYTSTVTGDSIVEVAAGVIKTKNSAAADEIEITEMWDFVYVVDDETVAKTDGGGTRIRAGRAVGLDGGGVFVLVGLMMTAGDAVTLTGAETLTNKTLTTPTIGSMTNATHDHEDAAGGGQITPADALDAAVPATLGGTGQTTTTAGDVLYGAAGNTIEKLAVGTANQVLKTNAGADAPEWGDMLDPDLKGTIQIPITSFVDVAATQLTTFLDGASDQPGLELTHSKALSIRWNNHAAPLAVMSNFVMPADADITANATLKVIASKVGATAADAVTFTVEAFNQVDAALHDADADFGGTTTAMTGDAATKTVQQESLTLALADLGAVGSNVTLTIKPTDTLLDDDDVCLHSVSIEYTKKLAA